MVQDAWLKTALEITGGFETAGNPWAGIAGDGDGMGLSCGVLQWNIGSGTLQPLITRAGEARVIAAMPRFGADLWRAVHAPRDAALSIVRGWQTKGRLQPAARAELAAFLATPAMIVAQIEAAQGIARKAGKLAAAWATACRKPLNQRDFCWFFDLVTQNGGLNGLSFADVRHCVKAHGNEAVAITAICDHLAATPLSGAGAKDARRNADLWRGSVGNADLFILSHLRAEKARAGYRAVVMNRKGSIAAGQGWVNGELVSFEERF